MGRHVIVGAGGIGRGIAEELVGRGEEVVLAARSGVSDAPGGVRPARVDAADAEALTALARGADTLVNAMNPASYTAWEREWPPLAAALLRAAERTGAGLLTVSNLYGYGRVDAPMTEDTPLAPAGHKGALRARMWLDALAAHEDGRIRAAEVRPSDYFGPGARAQTSVLNDLVLRRAVRGRSVILPFGDPDAPHSWTFQPDVARLVAVLALDERSWGRAWHVPSPAPLSMRQVVAEVARLTGGREVRIRRLPGAVRGALRVLPLVREFDETSHQFERPYVLDASAAEATFGVTATPFEPALKQTLAAW